MCGEGINGKGTLLCNWLQMQADLRANGLSEVLYVDMLVFCEARRDQVEVRRQRQEKSVQLSLSKVASLRAAVNWAQRLTQLPDLPGGCRLVHQQLDRAQALPGAGEYMADSQDRKKTVLVQDPALIQMKPSCLPAPLSHPTAVLQFTQDPVPQMCSSPPAQPGCHYAYTAARAELSG